MIRERIANFKNRLIRIHDDEPLSKLSLCVIIALDIFILSVLFTGLADHTRQLTAPTDAVPYECREVLVQKNWTEANRLSKLQNLVLSDYRNYSYRYTSRLAASRVEKMLPVCREFFKKIQVVAEDKEILSLFKTRADLEMRKDQTTDGFREGKDVYDTSLLENIADQEPGQKTLPSVAGDMKAKARAIEDFNARITEINARLNNSWKIKDLWAFIDEWDDGRRGLLVKELKKLEQWYPFKELLWQLLFLLPLFTVFYLWGVRSVRKEARLQTLISAHLMVVTAIPIFFKILEVTLELIPRHFFKKFFEILNRLHIIAVWHYILIFAAIGAALLIIYIIQKKIFNRRRLERKRLAKSQCRRCGKKLPEKASICPFCGSDQQTACPGCGLRTFAAGDYCVNCGKSLDAS